MIKFDLIPTWVYLAIALGACGASGIVGWKVRDYDYQQHLKADAEALLKASERARNTEATNEQTSSIIGQRVEVEKERIRTVTQTIIKEVPVYVTNEADDRCTVPDGAVRLLDAAASGNPPAPYAPGESPDAPSGHDLSGVVSSVVNNYGYTHELEATVKGWQDWYAQVVKDWPKQ